MQTRSALAHTFAAKHPVEAAQIFERLGIEEAVLGLASMPPQLAATLLTNFNLSAAVHCLERLDEAKAVAIAPHLPFEIAASLLRGLPAERRTVLLAGLSPASSEPLQRALQYPAGSAGALMNPRVLTLPDDITVGEALERVRQSPEHAMYYLYLVDRQQALTGVVNIRELMLADPQKKLTSIASTELEDLSAHTHGKDIAAHPGWLYFHALPVVDEGRRLVGVLRHKALRRLMSESEAQQARDAEHIRYAGEALGDLYRIGMAGLARGAFSALAGRQDSGKEKGS